MWIIETILVAKSLFIRKVSEILISFRYAFVLKIHQLTHLLRCKKIYSNWSEYEITALRVGSLVNDTTTDIVMPLAFFWKVC